MFLHSGDHSYRRIFLAASLAFIALTIVLARFALAAEVQAPSARTVSQHQTEQNFFQLFPDARMHWGNRLQRPLILSGLDVKVGSAGRAATVRDFLNGISFAFGERKGTADERWTELSEPRVVYHCDRLTMQSLEGLATGKDIEPNCPEGTLYSFQQVIDGLPYFDGSIGAWFTKGGKLNKIIGEYLGWISVSGTARLDEEEAKDIAAAEIDSIAESSRYRNVQLGWKFKNGNLVPTWRLRVANHESNIDVTFYIDAGSGDIIDAINMIDGSPGDEFNLLAGGDTLDSQASVVCNEPAERYRWLDNSYVASGEYAAFSPDIHAYDFWNADLSTGSDCVIDVRRTNDTTLSWPYYPLFNYHCDSAATGETCNNNDLGTTVNWRAISTWTAYNHTIYALNYFKNQLGFNEDFYYVDGFRHDTNYPANHSLAIIVNKDTDTSTIEDQLCCAIGEDCPSNCFRETGFPHGAANDECWEDTRNFSTLYSEDRYDGEEPDIWHPTIVFSDANPSTSSSWWKYWGGENAAFYKTSIMHYAPYHEITHYVQKAFNDSEYWKGSYCQQNYASASCGSGTKDFNSDESASFKEGFAMYYGASILDVKPGQYDKVQLNCTSDEINLIYDQIYQCCYGAYQSGHVITQIFWDIREKTSAEYADKLAYLTIRELGLSEASTLSELADLATELTLQEDDEDEDEEGLLGECPGRPSGACYQDVVDSFEDHGVCVSDPYCAYTVRNCSNCDASTCAACSGVRCFEDRTENCLGVSPVNFSTECTPQTDTICCAGSPSACHRAAVVTCGLHNSLAACAEACVDENWDQQYRECLRDDIRAWDCDACDGVPK